MSQRRVIYCSEWKSPLHVANTPSTSAFARFCAASGTPKNKVSPRSHGGSLVTPQGERLRI